MVDDEVLLPDGSETIAAVVAHAPRIARRIGNEFQVRPVQARHLAHLVEREHAVDAEHAVVGGTERALHEAPQFHRHGRLDVEPDHDAAAATLQRGLEQSHQIFGLFEDFDFGIADDAEGAHALHRIARKQLADEQAGHAFDGDHAHGAAVASLRQAHEALDAVGHADQRVHRLAVLAAGELQSQRKPQIGDERKRMRRIDGKRRQEREDVSEKVVFQPGLFRLGHVLPVDQNDSGIGEQTAQLAPLRLLILDQNRHRLGDTHKLLRRRQPFRTHGGDALAQLGAETGDADHEEFVEIVRRDRKEFQPFKQWIFGIGRFLKHPPIEVQPRYFTVDEAVRTGGKIGVRRMRDCLGRPQRLLQPPHRLGFSFNRSGLAAIGHGGSVLLKGYVGHLW